MLAALVLTVALLPALAAMPRAANELGDDWAVISASTFSASPLHVGDRDVGLVITLRNLRPGDVDAANGDERMYCVTAEVYGVKDRDGRLLAPGASPVTWTVSRQDNNGNGFQLGRLGEPQSTLALPAFQLDVKGVGARPGTYNVTFRIGYSMMNSQTEGDLTAYNEDEDTVQFTIASNVDAGTPVPLADDLSPVPLYGGASFQLLAIPVTTLSGPLGQVVATLSVPAGGALQLSAPAGSSLSASLGRLTGTATFYFRVDVPMADPGVYNASNANVTLTVQYIRERNWNGSAVSVSAGEEGLPLAFTIDYTPMLNATGAAPAVIDRSTPVSNLTVFLRNEGNADLSRVKVSLDVSNYFAGGAYYYDGDGNRVAVSLEQTVPSIKRGGVASVVYPMAVLSSLPLGTHRLPVGYSGYYEKAGAGSASSGLYPMSDAMFLHLRGALPAVEVQVKAPAPRVFIGAAPAGQPALNPGGESENVLIQLEIVNGELLELRDAALTLVSGAGTILRNRAAPDARALEPARLGALAPGERRLVGFVADLDRSSAAGLQLVTARFNATGAGSNTPVGLEQKVAVRLASFGPPLSFSADGELPLGGPTHGVPLTVDIINSGQSRLTGVSARLRCGSPTPLVNPSDRTAQWLDQSELGLLEALSSSRAVFQADLDPNTTAQTYSIGIEVAGAYLSSGERFNVSGVFKLRVLPAPARLAVLSVALSPDPPQAGKAFTLTVRVKNVGSDTARGAWVALGDLAGELPGGQSPLPPAPSPFSAEVAVKYLGDLRPGDELSAAFNMLSDASAPGGRLYRQPVLFGFDGQTGSPNGQTAAVTVKLKAAPSAAPATELDWQLLLLTIGFVAVLAVLIAVLVWPPSGRARAQPAQAKPLPEGVAPAGPPTEIAVAKPVLQPEQPELPLPPPPPPPPPPAQEPAEPAPPSQYPPPVQSAKLPLPPPPPPPPVAPPVADGGGKMPPGARSRPGPLENYRIPGADEEPRYAPPEKPKTYSGREVPMRLCPSCGNEVKMRFVKCPICGADLPPAA
jgi:hypothetical protein